LTLPLLPPVNLLRLIFTVPLSGVKKTWTLNDQADGLSSSSRYFPMNRDTRRTRFTFAFHPVPGDKTKSMSEQNIQTKRQAPVGSIATAIVYPVLRDKFGIGGDAGLSTPISVKWAGFAELLTKGFNALPPGCLVGLALGIGVGVLLTIMLKSGETTCPPLRQLVLVC
jgi:hypothetical protein